MTGPIRPSGLRPGAMGAGGFASPALSTSREIHVTGLPRHGGTVEEIATLLYRPARFQVPSQSFTHEPTPPFADGRLPVYDGGRDAWRWCEQAPAA